MPTIFERIETGMQGNNLASSLATQVTKLTGVGSQLAALAHGEMPSLGALRDGLLNTALPNVDVTGDFAGALTSLGGAIPSDLSGLTGGLTTALGGLQGSVSTNIVGQVEKITAAILALQKLFESGFTTITLPPASQPAGSAGTGGTSTPPAGSGSASTPPSGGGAGSGAGSTAGAGTPPPAPAEEARQRRLDTARALDTALAAVAPFTPATLIVFVHDRLQQIPKAMAGRKLPFLDDILDLFSNAVALQAMDAAALQAYLNTTVQNLAVFLRSTGNKPLSDLAGQLTTLSAKTDLGQLKAEMGALAASLARIGAAVQGGGPSGSAADIAAANGTLDTLLPRIAALDADLFSGQADAAERALERLPVEAERHMRRAADAVQPVAQAQLLQSLGDRLASAIQANAPDGVAKDVEDLLAQAVKALDIVNVIPIREPMLTAVDAVKTAADGIDNLIAQAASETALLFDQVDTLLAQVDTSSVTEAIQKAIADFQTALEQQADALFAPVKKAIADGVKAINDAVSGFSADEIVNALKDAIDKLAGVLDSSEVKSAVDTIHQAIESATQQLQIISFTPVTGEVIAGIDDITRKLKSIDPAKLSMTVKLALQAAVAILPGDLKPVTGPLAGEFGDLVDKGPKPLLVTIEAQPAKLLAQVKGFSPANLIGDQLSKPFQDLIGQLEQFQPGALLAPVEDALAGIKDKVRQTANPGQLLAPLETLFNELLAQFDKLKPEELVKPLDDQIRNVIDSVLSALPVDDVLHAFDAVLAPFQSAREIAGVVKNVLEKIVALVEGLADAENQIRVWLQPVFDHIDQMADVASLQPAFDQVTAAVNALKADAMQAALETAVAGLRDGIAALNPKQALASVAAAYATVKPGAAHDSAIQALVARFNPVSPEFARPFDGFDRWHQEIVRDQQAFRDLMVHWDKRFHGPKRPLDGFVHPAITAADLKQILREALESEVVQPLAHLLGIVQTAAAGARPPLAKVTAFIDAFDEKLDDLLTGPGALGGLRDAINELVTRLRNINFQFLATEMNATFETVRGKLAAVSPTVIRTAVEQAFNDALDLLDISRLLPKTELDTIDGDYQKIIDELKKFDPKTLIEDVVQPVFDEKITPLVEAFDITPLIQAVIERLEALKGELEAELDKTDKSYQQMLQAVPTISLTDLGDVAGAVGDIAGDIGGSLGF
jgi:hypothetical protein